MNEPEDKLTRTGILRAEFGTAWRWWSWMRQQFTPTSLTALGVVAATLGGWALTLTQQVREHTTEIRVLREDIVPDHELRSKVDVLSSQVDDLRGDVSKIQNAFMPSYLEADKRAAAELERRRKRK